MKRECLKKDMNIIGKLKQADEKIHEQEEEIKTLQTKLSNAKTESDHLLINKENEFKVMIHKDNKKFII